MKTLNFKTTLLLALSIFVSTAIFASNNNLPDNDGDIVVYVDKSGSVNSTIAETYDIVDDFDVKFANALKVLTNGYGKVAKVHKAGDVTFYDFVKDHNVARLVVNENDKLLMLIQDEIK